MRKLLKLKEWLTVPDAARHLSILFGEEVGEADVLRLALDGHLTLSVFFVNHARACCGPIVPLKDAKRYKLQMPEGEPVHCIQGLCIKEGEVLELGESVVALEGVWDLTMLGAERLDVEHKYQMLTSGPAVDLVFLDGPIVSREDGTAYRLEAHFADNEFFDKKKLEKPWNNPANYHPAGGLPPDSVFVVRIPALRRLEARILSPSSSAATRTGNGRADRGACIASIAKSRRLQRLGRPNIGQTRPSSANFRDFARTVQAS